MKQVAQIMRTGVIDVFDVPVPSLGDDFVLVANRASLISAGTEKTKVDMGRKSLLQKARARPDLVAQVIRKIQAEGLVKTARAVGARLDSLSALGYSCAGTVVAVGGRVQGLSPGDRVACGGADYANHAELVAVPRNLVVRIPEQVPFEEAAFCTLGAIALQGVRLAGPQIGETFLVVGLGLLGQIAVQLLRANGCRVIATDLDESLVRRAEGYGAIGCGSGSDLPGTCRHQTAGHGVDGVLVCAGSSSNSIIELCGEVTREKGRVVVVGAVRMDIPREPYFRKEISLVISRSYGPGRYDRRYEEDGQDYPFAYVRFSEQRNMQSIAELIADRRLDVGSLITHRFPVDDAAQAYALIEGRKTEPYIGIVLEYDGAASRSVAPVVVAADARKVSGDAIQLACYGAGNYATASLLPLLAGRKDVSLKGVYTASGRSAQAVARRFGFQYCANDLEQLLAPDVDAVLIASRHDSHAAAVCDALARGKHVYVEKPMGLTVEELARIVAARQAHPGSRLLVGFNRRFAPATQAVRQYFAGVSGPFVINIRVNAGHIPADHWIQHPVIGGGRILGEACHFVDLAAALAGSLPVRVHAMAVADASKSPTSADNVCIVLQFANGSIANIAYVASGSKAMPKERVEVFAGGRAAVIDDFRRVDCYGSGAGSSRAWSGSQDKGQTAMIEGWLASLRGGAPAVEFNVLLMVSLATIRCVESMCVGMPLDVGEHLLVTTTEEGDVVQHS